MKSLACVGAFTLGAIAGGWATFKVVVFAFGYRFDHPVDDRAIIREDEYVKIVRLNKERASDVAEIWAVVHKDRIK